MHYNMYKLLQSLNPCGTNTHVLEIIKVLKLLRNIIFPSKKNPDVTTTCGHFYSTSSDLPMLKFVSLFCPSQGQRRSFLRITAVLGLYQNRMSHFYIIFYATVVTCMRASLLISIVNFHAKTLVGLKMSRLSKAVSSEMVCLCDCQLFYYESR